MDSIQFQEKSYLIREIFLPDFGEILISTTSLNEALMDTKGDYTSNEAKLIDEQIFYFVEEDEIIFHNEKLRNLLLKQLK